MVTDDLFNISYAQGYKDGYTKAIDEFTGNFIDYVNNESGKHLYSENALALAEQLKKIRLQTKL